MTARRRSQRGRFREEVGYKDASTTLKISLLSFLRYYLYSFGLGLIIRNGLERFIYSGTRERYFFQGIINLPTKIIEENKQIKGITRALKSNI